MSVRIQLLGTLRVDSPDGVLHEADFRGRRAVLLFARLATDAGQGVTAEELAEAVWGWSPPPSWPAALRNAIAVLRSALDTVGLHDLVKYSTGTYLLELPAGSTVDSAEIAAAASAAELALSSDDWSEARWISARALEAATGTLLPGPISPWVEERRADVQEAVTRLRRVAGEATLHAGELVEAEAIAHRLVAEAPLREHSHRFLMRVLDAGGNTGEALRAYEACRRTLREELGVSPSDATTQLFEALLASGDAPASPEPPRRSHAVSPMLLAYSGEGFVGRTRELARIADDRVRIGESGPLLIRIEGESGIGKTRLAAEATAAAYDAGLAVLYGRADDRVNVPFRPVVEAMGAFLSTCSIDEQRRLLGDHAKVLARLLPSLRAAADPVAPTGIADADQHRLTSAVEHVLGLASAGRGAMLVLDDMHYAIESTVRLVKEITQERTHLRILVLVLHRPGGPQQELLEELSDRPNGSTTSLGPLDPSAVGSLVRRWLGPSLAVSPDGLSAELWERTSGNPLFVTELLRSVDPDGTLDLPARSTRIEELVRQRVAALPNPALAVLTVAAVLGLEFDPEVVAAAQRAPLDEVQGALAAARRDGLIVPAASEPGWMAFRHAVVHESLAAPVSTDARMEIHQRIGSVLEDEGTPPASLAALAYHFDAAAPLGEWRRAVRYLLRVARTADEEWMHDEVVDACRRALAVLDDAGDPDPRARLDALVLLGRAEGLQGRPEVGEEIIATAFVQARVLDDPVRAAAAALAFEPSFDSDMWTLPAPVVQRCEEALSFLGDRAPLLRARLLGRLACGVGWTSDGDAARTFADEALGLARAVHDPSTLVAVLRTWRRTLTGTGRVAEQRELEAELLPLARSLDDVGTELSMLACRFETALEAGEGGVLEELLDDLDLRCVGAARGGPRHMAAYSRAALALLRGDLDAADLLVEEAARVGRRQGIDPFITDSVRLMQLSGVRWEQGRLAEVRDELAEGLAGSGVPEWMGEVAFVDAALGDLDGARRNLDLVFKGFAEGGARPAVSIGFLAHMAEPVAAVRDLDRASALYDLLAPHAGIGTFFSYFAGPVDWHLGVIARLLGQDLAAQAHFRAAEELCHRLGSPRWASRCAQARAGF